MKKKDINKDFPLRIKINFKKLFDNYRGKLDSKNKVVQNRVQEILAVAEQYPILSDGFDSIEQMEEYQEQIDFVLEDLFSSILEDNEIKMATLPFQDYVFKSSRRYKDILMAAGPDYKIELVDFSEDYFYIMGCSIILKSYYGYNVDFRRPFYYNIPDAKGIIRHYRVLYNGDFVGIEENG